MHLHTTLTQDDEPDDVRFDKAEADREMEVTTQAIVLHEVRSTIG